MCDLPTIIALLGTAGGLITASLIALGVAIVLNNGFFSAPASPAAMIIAGGLLVGAVVALVPAAGKINDYVQCMGAATACAGELSNLQNALTALISVLLIQATASFVAAGIAWVPWAGQIPMWVILGSLVMQLILIPTIIAFFNDLVRCAEAAAAATAAATEPLVLSPFIAVLVVGIVYLASAYVYVYYSQRNKD